MPGVGPLDVWRLASYGGGIFIPVKDAWPGARGGTYGGGRYLLDTVKGADLGAGPQRRSRSCSTSTSRTTRRAPTTRCGRARWRSPGNTVAVEIPVGERLLRVTLGRLLRWGHLRNHDGFPAS